MQKFKSGKNIYFPISNYAGGGGSSKLTGVGEGLFLTVDAVGNIVGTDVTWETVVTPANTFTVANASTNYSPTISTTGTDTNIDLTLEAKGTGAIILSAVPALSLMSNGLVVNNSGTGNVYDDFIAKTLSYSVGLTVDASADNIIHAAKTTLSPSATQTIAAVGNTILANASMIVLDPSSDLTLTSAPTIANGTTGQIIVLTCGNAEANTVTIQDQGTLASSNLQLGATTRAITASKTLTLIFDGSDWLEIAYGNN